MTNARLELAKRIGKIALPILVLAVLVFCVFSQQHQISALKQQHSQDVKTVEQSKQDIVGLNAQLKSGDDERKQLQQQLDDLKTQIDSLSKETAALKKEIDDERKATAALQESIRSGRTVTLTATAYGIDCAGCSGRTRTGTKPAVGRTVAVDPRVIKLGSKLYIKFPKAPQYDGYYVAEDTGGAINGYKMDVYMGTERAASPFGHKEAIVTILS